MTEAQLALLLGMGRDPITGEQLGRAYREVHVGSATGSHERIAELDPGLTPRGARGRGRAGSKPRRPNAAAAHAVAGFDFTFSVPKSVSVLWGVADAGTQALIVDAHHAAVAEVLDFFEREVAATRAGVDAGDGAVAQVDVARQSPRRRTTTGTPGPATRSSTPTSSSPTRSKPLADGRWRSLDGRPMHAAVVALSEHYNAVLADRLTGTSASSGNARRGAPTATRSGRSTGVSEDLIAEFSSRTREIEGRRRTD